MCTSQGRHPPLHVEFENRMYRFRKINNDLDLPTQIITTTTDSTINRPKLSLSGTRDQVSLYATTTTDNNNMKEKMSEESSSSGDDENLHRQSISQLLVDFGEEQCPPLAIIDEENPSIAENPLDEN